MSKSRDKMQLTVELMRRGAVMMKEPCPIDNGVQVRYKGKVFCTSHDDLERHSQARRSPMVTSLRVSRTWSW